MRLRLRLLVNIITVIFITATLVTVFNYYISDVFIFNYFFYFKYGEMSESVVIFLGQQFVTNDETYF